MALARAARRRRHCRRRRRADDALVRLRRHRYLPRFFEPDALAASGGGFVLTYSLGNKTYFYGFGSTIAAEQRGKAEKFVDAVGSETKFVYTPVVRVFRKTSDHFRVVTYRGAAGNVETLRTTDEHPFWVEGVGWVAARNLMAGMQVGGIAGDGAAPQFLLPPEEWAVPAGAPRR